MALRLSIYVFILIFNVIFVFVGLLSSSLEEFTKKEKRNQQKTKNKKSNSRENLPKGEKLEVTKHFRKIQRKILFGNDVIFVYVWEKKKFGLFFKFFRVENYNKFGVVENIFLEN